MPETAYRQPAPTGAAITHHYGPKVHLLSDAWALSILARLGSPDIDTLTFHTLLEAAYRRLLHAVTAELPTTQVDVPTRMAALETRGRYEGSVLDPAHPVVIVDVARAGILPSLVFQRALLEVLDSSALRVDHLYMQRLTDAEGRVTGVDLSGSKIGGPVQDATLLIPDPMGATGGTILRVVEHYQRTLGETPRRVVACHLMITPEYVQRLTAEVPEVEIYALRMDRGLSPEAVLATPLGSTHDERGLTDTQYIVPGAGGLGELVNNAFV